jgi:hypothetical protein
MTNAKANAFLNGVNSSKFNTDKAKIYRILEKQPLTLDGLVLKGFKKETASARISDLMDLGLVKAIGENVSFFQVVKDEEEIKLLIECRNHANYLNWVKRGKELGYFKKYMNQ